MRQLFTKIATTGNLIAVILFWMAVWLYRAMIVSLTGGVVGLVISPVVKLIFFSQTEWIHALQFGFITGCQYAGIWATGVAIVWVVIDRNQIKTDASKLLAPKHVACEID